MSSPVNDPLIVSVRRDYQEGTVNMENSFESFKDPIDEDEAVLNQMGYKQELYRGFSSLMNFSFCFTAVAVVSSLSGLFPTAMATGGP
ncbi:hypothetical protein HDV02_001044, partial [Globomyces sp. JEL0801]